jgi:probable F420-dependent oxidoreductase
VKFIITVPGLFLSPKVIDPWHVEMTPADIIHYSRRVDELGYDYIRVPEHLLIPRELSESMGTKWTEPVTTMAFLAGATNQISFVTGILVLPYHDPVILAKGIATLDYLSGGRVTLGVGVGHVEKEFEALNIPFEDRGVIGSEYIQAIKELWTSDDPTFDGRFVQFKDVVFDPKPVQKPHPPIWVGGLSKAALRRAATLGDGWQPLASRPLSELTSMLDYLREQPAYQQRTRPFDIVMQRAIAGETPSGAAVGSDELVQRFGELKELGLTHTSPAIGKARSMEESLDELQRFAEDVMPLCRD